LAGRLIVDFILRSLGKPYLRYLNGIIIAGKEKTAVTQKRQL